VSEQPQQAPLAGIRIVDFSRILAGPLATMVLADLGADVIKVERPGVGDDTRAWGPPFAEQREDGAAAYFLSLNRNKRSVALDLSTEADQAFARRLALSGDVVVENFRPGLMKTFGLDYETLSAEKPSLVYCSLTAFDDETTGETNESRPGYDIIVQALSGLMSVTGEPGGEPVKVGVAMLDVVTGLYAANGIQAALRSRDASGHGQRLSVSLFGASVAAMVNQAANYLIGGLVPGPLGTAHPNIVPYQVFAASDRPFVLAVGNDRHFARTCEVIGRPELATDERFATNEARVRNRDELVPLLAGIFASKPASAWLTALETAKVPCSPVRRLDEVFASPEGAALVRDAGDGVRLVADPVLDAPMQRPPPGLGEHTEELREELEIS
jgi:crotonobetainyl-CoA:carnitine CoA-transferase CaiB-like acyl-CoA transferase